MRILGHRFHTFCEDVLYRLLSQHTIYLATDRLPWGDMRPLPPNVIECTVETTPWDQIDLALCLWPDQLQYIRDVKHIPCVFHVDQMPPDAVTPALWRAIVQDTPTLYYSEEEAQAWNMGRPIVRPQPIDTDFWTGYNPTIPHAITIASRPISTWGHEVKGWDVLKRVYKEVPIQVVAGSDPEFPLSSPMIHTEEHMRATLREHWVYFNCAWKLDRSPLEAMSVGMPVVALKHRCNVYTTFFTHGEDIYIAKDADEMVRYTKLLLEHKELAGLIGANARQVIKTRFRPTASLAGYERAFQLARA